MNINKYIKLKYVLLITCFIVILLGLFYLYNYLYNNIEPFSVTQWKSTSPQNYYKGELLIDDRNVDVNITTITKTTPCEYITSNNKGLYGTDNIYLYNFNNNDKKWYITPIKHIRPSITNPLYNDNTDNCRFKTKLVASKHTLWYYNDDLNQKQGINIDCLNYINLDTDGNPINENSTGLISSEFGTFQGMARDESNNLYIRSDRSQNNNAKLLKFDSNFNFLWSHESSLGSYRDIHISDEEIFTITSYNFQKYDLDGNILPIN